MASITQSGRAVVLIGPVPEMNKNVPNQLIKDLLMGRKSDIHVREEDFLVRQIETIPVLNLLTSDRVKVVFPHSRLCAGGLCPAVAGGKPLYYDDNHLSHFGALTLAPMIAEAIRKSANP